MICITGASGTLGSEVIRPLESAKVPFRGAYFSNGRAQAAGTRGIEAVVIDYNRPETLRAAFQGCDRIYFLGPNVPHQTELERNAAVAVKALTYDDLASETSRALGRPISHINLSPSDLKTGMLALGMPEEIADRMLNLERYFREGRANLITDDIKHVTGQEPRHIAEFVRETARTGIWEVEAAGAPR